MRNALVSSCNNYIIARINVINFKYEAQKQFREIIKDFQTRKGEDNHAEK